MARADREEAFMNLLEGIAEKYYPGLYALVDDPIDDLVGMPGMKAHLVIGESPKMRREDIRALAMVSPWTVPVPSLPSLWKELLLKAAGKDLRIDIYVRKQDIHSIQREVRNLNPQARVLPVPRTKTASGAVVLPILA